MEQRKYRKKKSFKKLIKHKTLRKRNFLSLLSIIISTILIIFLGKINILPIKYFALISLILLIVDGIGILFINVHKKTILKILGIIILILSIVSSCIGLYYLSSTNHFINESFTTKKTYIKNTYYVIGKNNIQLKESDISGEISTYTETVNLTKALEKLNSKYPVKEKQYDDIGTLFDNINNGIDKFMLIEKSSYEIVFSISDTLDKNDYIILYEFDVYTKRKEKENTSTDKFNIFVGGTDFAGLMDFNMIVTVNKKNHKIILTSIPRDYYIEVFGKDGRYDKLSFMNAYGSDVNKDSLEKLFDIQIDYSVIVETSSLVTIVDYLGGIEFCSDYDFTTTHALVTNTYNDSGTKLHVVKGCQHLDGVETLTVARERNAFPGRDRIRQENCQKILLAIFKKLISTDTLLHYNETLNTLSSTYETDIPKNIITEAAKDILNNGNKWTIETQSVDGVDGKDKVHLSNMIDWVMYPDNNTVTAASNKIKETLQ